MFLLGSYIELSKRYFTTALVASLFHKLVRLFERPSCFRTFELNFMSLLLNKSQNFSHVLDILYQLRLNDNISYVLFEDKSCCL